MFPGDYEALKNTHQLDRDPAGSRNIANNNAMQRTRVTKVTNDLTIKGLPDQPIKGRYIGCVSLIPIFAIFAIIGWDDIILVSDVIRTWLRHAL